MKTNTRERIGVESGLIALLIVSSVCMFAQNKDWRSAIQDPLESQYPLTKASADKSTIVTAGAVLVLRKDDLVMFATSSLSPPANTYKDGRITQSLFGKLGKTATDGSTRTFVKGEKFWVTKIEVKDDAVVFQLLSDPFNDARYWTSLKFPFPKGSPPPADQISTIVAQVLGVDEPAAAAPPPDPPAPAAPVGRALPGYVPPGYPQGLSPEAQAQMQQAMLAPLEAALQNARTPELKARLQARIDRIKAMQVPAATPPAAPAAEAALAPIPPPPPPAPDPVVETKSLEAGQTKDQVVAILGKPEKTFKIGTKEIYQYKDIKVTFVNGKMTDAQ